MKDISTETTGVTTTVTGFNAKTIRDFYDKLFTLLAGSRPKVSAMFQNNIDGFDGFMTARHTFDTHMGTVAHVSTANGNGMHEVIYFNKRLITVVPDEDGNTAVITVHRSDDVPHNGVHIHDAIIEMVSADD